MVEIILLAIALAMDAFAVSIGLGAERAVGASRSSLNTNQNQNPNRIHIPTYTENKAPKVQKTQGVQSSRGVLKLALIAGVYFGVSQGVMPLFGYLLGAAILSQLASAAPWIGFVILLVLGAKMVFEALTIKAVSAEGVEEAVSIQINHKMMAPLAIATSIDALAAGFTLNLLAISAVVACFIIAAITACFSFCGVYLGYQSGTWLEHKATLLGGVVLIAIGINMVT